MQLGIISPGVLPIPAVEGGAVENLIQFIIEENEKNHDFDIVVYSIRNPKAQKKSKKYSFTKIIYIDDTKQIYKCQRGFRYILNRFLNFKVSNAFINQINKEINKQNFDVILIENRPDFIYTISKNTKTKILIHLHNLYENESTLMNKNILDKASKILVVSNYIKRMLKDYKVDEKIETLYNGIETLKYKEIESKEVNSLKRKYNISANDTVILFSGRLTKQKGVIELIKAFKMIENLDVKLMIVGKLDFNDKYHQIIKSECESIKNRVIFTDYIKYELMPKVYSVSDIVVIPSIGPEAAALVVLEARAARKAIIASDEGGIPEMLDNKGIIVKNDSEFVRNLSVQLNELVNNISLRNMLSNNSPNNLIDFDIAAYYNNFKNILFNLDDDNI